MAAIHEAGPSSATTPEENDTMAPSRSFFNKLITANHILHFHNVVDAYGHISVRNPQDPSTFFMSRNLAPALVSGREDIEQYHVSDASAVSEGASKGYIERYIHSEVYKKYKDVNAVIHAHSEAVLPFSISSVPLRPVFHMAGLMGSRIPVFDISLHYKSSDSTHSLLVCNEHLGAALAAGFNPSSLTSKATNLVYNLVSSAAPELTAYPPHTTVLMRGHGLTCIGTSVEDAVNRALYTCANARIQTTALLMQGAHNVSIVGDRFADVKEAGAAKTEGIKYLSDRETRDAGGSIGLNTDRQWKLWVAEIANCGLYKNAMSSSDSG